MHKQNYFFFGCFWIACFENDYYIRFENSILDNEKWNHVGNYILISINSFLMNFLLVCRSDYQHNHLIASF